MCWTELPTGVIKLHLHLDAMQYAFNCCCLTWLLKKFTASLDLLDVFFISKHLLFPLCSPTLSIISLVPSLILHSKRMNKQETNSGNLLQLESGEKKRQPYSKDQALYNFCQNIQVLWNSENYFVTRWWKKKNRRKLPPRLPLLG